MGCCSSRENDDGKLEYSIRNKAKILEAISKKEDLVPHFSEGWRLHHSIEGEDKKRKTFLTFAREADNLEVFKGSMFTVNEVALLEKVRNTSNYEFIFANTDYLNTLVKNYEANGFTLQNEAAIDFFLTQEKLHSGNAEKAKPFVLLRASFGVAKAALVDEKEAPKGDEKKETPKGEEKKKEEIHKEEKK